MDFYVTKSVNCTVTTALIGDCDIFVEGMQVYQHCFVFLAYSKTYELFLVKNYIWKKKSEPAEQIYST